MVPGNPLLDDWTGPYGLPPYAATRVEHFAPAFETAMAEHVAEIEAVAAAPAAATFANTVTALEAAGDRLGRIAAMFYQVCGTDTTPQLQALERDLAPKLTAHHLRLAQDQRLFRRIDGLNVDDLDPEQRQVRERYVRMFVKAGARLDDAGRARLKTIAERVSTLATTFSQNVLADEQSWVMVLTAEDLAGLSPQLIAGAKATAIGLDKPDAWAITLSRSAVVPFL
jgi:peptidyl-dipeptidase Dcp